MRPAILTAAIITLAGLIWAIAPRRRRLMSEPVLDRLRSDLMECASLSYEEADELVMLAVEFGRELRRRREDRQYRKSARILARQIARSEHYIKARPLLRNGTAWR